MEELEPLDPQLVSQVLSSPPFCTVTGVINLRDLGHYQSESVPNSITRPRFVFRSGEISGIAENGRAELVALGIKTVFDLRSDTEIEKYNSPIPTIDGIQVIHAPVFKREDYSPEMMAKRFALYASGKTEAFMELYSQILEHAGPSYGAILRHIRDASPTDGLLFHCTAGKDRTGVLAAIILKLAGVKDKDIAEDYQLTRYGREPARAKIMSRLSQEPLFASNNEAALNMFTCRYETMMAFLKLMEEKYDGVESYCKQFLGLSDHDLVRIRQNILVSSQSYL